MQLSRRDFVKATAAVAATVSLAKLLPTDLLAVTGGQPDDTPSEKVLITCHDMGPFRAHVKNGVWYKSSAFRPNYLTGNFASAMRNRVYAPDRVRYPMKRVGWQPGGKSPTDNRGKGEFVRITWDEATTLAANELIRVKTTYGNSAILKGRSGHQQKATVHNRGTTHSTLLGLFGGYTQIVGGTSTAGWDDGAPYSWGLASPYKENNNSDILMNTKLYIVWGLDPLLSEVRFGRDSVQFYYAMKKAGIKIYVIDPWFNDTAALIADKYITLVPSTDEAIMAAIAYVWIDEDLYDKEFVATHSVGFDKFEAYVTGKEDGVPKTPEWAESISTVPAETIRALAREWASVPTYLHCYYAGANRRAYSEQWVRMCISLQTMLGYLGKPGCGLGAPSGDVAQFGYRGGPAAMKGPGNMPSVPNPVKQEIEHVLFGYGILSPPISWVKQVWPKTYPLASNSEIKLEYDVGATDVIQQIPGTPLTARAYKSTKLECRIQQPIWWNAAALFADIILPACTTIETEDLVSWKNLVIYMPKVIDPLFESKTDYEIFTLIAQKLGIESQFTQNRTIQDWIQYVYSKSNVPISLDELKAAGFYEFNYAASTGVSDELKAKLTSEYLPALSEGAPSAGALVKFNQDPASNKLSTPSGLIEFFSQTLEDFWHGDPEAPSVPKYIQSWEGKFSAKAQTYPLQLLSTHGKFARHSQWQNMSWMRDEVQMKSKTGYHNCMISVEDAEARGIKFDDIVKVFNDRGTILCAARVSPRMRPGVVVVNEGAWYKPMEPGNPDSIDMGGNPNVVLASRPLSKMDDGMAGHTTLVQVAKWEGA